MTIHYNDYDIAVQKIIEQVGKNVVLGVPLGIGKPIGVLNAFYRLAAQDQSITLTILTGLTLARPSIHSDLEKRFIEPILARILGDYVDPLYEKARRQQKLPKNIKVIEFFLTPGKYLKNSHVQQDYINSSYTNVASDVLNHSINVIAQQVACSTDTHSYSLSCNTDLFHEVVNYLNEKSKQGKKIAVVAEVNQHLPFMVGDAIVTSEQFTDIIDTKQYHSLFATPKPQLSAQDHLIGLYTSSLIKDNGCLQIGIGKLGDAIASALILRHKENNLYKDILKKLNIDKVDSLTPFQEGLYASTEMFSDGYMYLYKEKILKKRVYDHIGLQKLLNEKKISENITPDYLDILIDYQIIHSTLTEEDVLFLHRFGILNASIHYREGNLVFPSGEIISADLQQSKKIIIEKGLGASLKSGKVIHAGFFMGCKEFYQWLKTMVAEEMQQIDMTSIAKTNSLCWSHELAELQRQHARLVNSAMMITLEGAVVSDGLKNWQEVSGVGGQFDFADMAQKLPEARFIINCQSARRARGKVTSNIVWDYPNVALPRYLRDIIITEYGIADCRSKTDADIIKAILNITDSRFQTKLLKKAKKFGKIAADYEIPKIHQNNYPAVIQAIVKEIQDRGYCKSYPFGSELTEEEQVIQQALFILKESSKLKLMTVFLKSLFFAESDTNYEKYLSRMKLNRPKTFKEFISKKLLKLMIRRTSYKGNF